MGEVYVGVNSGWMSSMHCSMRMRLAASDLMARSHYNISIPGPIKYQPDDKYTPYANCTHSFISACRFSL